MANQQQQQQQRSYGPEEKTPVEARQGARGNHVYRILLWSLALAAIAYGIIHFATRTEDAGERNTVTEGAPPATQPEGATGAR